MNKLLLLCKKRMTVSLVVFAERKFEVSLGIYLTSRCSIILVCSDLLLKIPVIISGGETIASEIKFGYSRTSLTDDCQKLILGKCRKIVPPNKVFRSSCFASTLISLC